MKKLFYILLLTASLFGAGIDLTDYSLIIAPASWAATGGNAPASQYSGNMPEAVSGQTCTFTSFNASEGFIKSVSSIEQNTHYGDLTTPLTIAMTNTSTLTIEMWIKYQRNAGGVDQYLYGSTEEPSPYNSCYGLISAGNAVNCYFGTQAIGCLTRTTTTLTDGNTYHLVITKNGSAIKIYINGTEASYSGFHQTYAAGNITTTLTFYIGGVHYNTVNFLYSTNRIYWFGVNTTAFSTTRISANYAAGITMGYVGNNTGNLMALTLPTSSTHSHRRISYIRRFGF
jgi:hypothetical protein